MRSVWIKLFAAAFLLLGRGVRCAAPAVDPCRPPNFPTPAFKSAIFHVRDFGAIGNGTTNDTRAINQAIEKCSLSGGGDIQFPAGTYLAASIHLQSNVRLMLDKDAVISGAASGYDPPEPNPFDQYQDFGHSHFHNALMWGENIENFAIIGGRVNGGHIVEGEPSGRDIGDKVISLRSSRNLLFENVTHESGGHFVYLLNDCQNVTISSVTIKKSRDAINLVSCRNVQVHGCRFTGCGDDTVALKSDYALGRKIASENIYVWDSYFETACNGLIFGAETVGNFQNVNFWNIHIGRALKSAICIRSADGAVIDGVNYRNIAIEGARVPLSIIVSERLLNGEPEKKVGTIKNVKISDVTVTKCERGRDKQSGPVNISGRPESLLENITLENVKIRYRGGERETSLAPRSENHRHQNPAPLQALGFYLRDVQNLAFKNVEVTSEEPDRRPTLIATEINGFELDRFSSPRISGVETLRLEKVRNLNVRNSPGLIDRTAEMAESLKE